MIDGSMKRGVREEIHSSGMMTLVIDRVRDPRPTTETLLIAKEIEIVHLLTIGGKLLKKLLKY